MGGLEVRYYINLSSASTCLFLSTRLGPSSAESEHDPDHSSLTQVARLIRFLAIILSVGLNEMSGVCLIFILQLFNVISHYISIKRSDKSKRPIARSKYHVNVTILQLLMLMLALNFSSLFMWIKQLTTTFQMTWDADTFWSMDESPMGHTFWSPGLFVCFCVAFFINTDFPNTTCQMFSDAGNLIFVSSMVVILYGTLSVYRISYFITSALLIVAVPAAIEHYLPQ
ncbi:hypothetical protein NP493_209g02023 [Ridgeia piscesae]|uniref:GPI inositol-deacylase transmembrane domain-containing protein n=1 Tax=Ridgeia piscesae TaxID=27915 RepID=A0AAD9P149_RIDPI|nr:hypothetical protein NP493_209g02023 [Ridgeia piscesae]